MKLLFLLICSITITVFARRAEVNESDAIYKSIEIQKTIKSSGVFKMSYNSLIEIKKEAARTEFGLYRFNYNPFAETLDFIEARTINGKKIIRVKKSDIVIKPLAHKGPGFDTQNQVSVAYPEVEVGSQLELKYHLTRKVPTIPNLYTSHFKLGTNSVVENYKEFWISESPLYIETYDPQNYLEVIQTQNKIQMRLKKALYLKVIEENDSIYDPESLLWVAVSSIKKWDEFPKKTIEYYEKIINSKLPKKLQLIYQDAAEISDSVSQINLVTSKLAATIRYLGDWRLVKGAYHPHTLEEISESGYGDCKDMSVSAAAILRKLGYTVHVGFTNRGANIIRSPLKLAALNFDHAIVWAQKNGREFWIDPTNFTSYVQRTFPDIADREVVVIEPEGARLARTPANDFNSNTSETELNLSFDDSNVIIGNGRIQLTGYGAGLMTGRSLTSSKAELDHILAKWAIRIPDLLEWKFNDYDLSSRIVKDFSTEFSFKARWQPITTSAGKAYLVSSRDIIRILNTPLHNRIASLIISDPHQYKNKINFKGKNLYINKNLNCSGSNKWFDYSRDLTKVDDIIILNDQISVKQHTIEIQELKTPEFYQEQQKILSCMGDFAIVFKN